VAASIWAKQSQADVATALAAFTRWLINTTNLWSIVEAYSGAAGTKRRTPTSGSELDLDNAAFSAGGDFSWQTGTLATGDWIVLQSTNATGNKCQVYLEYDSTTRIYHALIPKADFTTGGTNVSPPNSPQGFPATTIGATMSGSPSLVGFTPQNAVMDYSAICDDSVINLICDDGVAGNREWMYVGAVESSHPNDVYPFVINDTPGNVYRSSTARWNKLSHVDGATGLVTGYGTYLAFAGGTSVQDPGQDGNDGEWSVIPAGVHDAQAAHMYSAVLKYVYLIAEDLASSGTLAGLTYMYMTSLATEGRMGWTWDGVTAYP